MCLKLEDVAVPQTSSQPQPLPSLALPGHGEQDDAASGAGSPGRHEDAFLNLSRKLLCFFRH